MHTITRRFTFDAAHRVLGHQGKCRHIHGHRYEVEVSCYATKLDHLGMVIDFSAVKEKVGKWIDTMLDHNLILHKDDPLLELEKDTLDVVLERPPYVMSDNPTAENIARLIYDRASLFLTSSLIKVSGVRVYETSNCWADYPGPPSDIENKQMLETKSPLTKQEILDRVFNTKGMDENEDQPESTAPGDAENSGGRKS